MTFNSYIFVLFFLPVVIIGYYLLNGLLKTKNSNTILLTFLVVTSSIFYGYYNVSYLFLLWGSIVFNWFISKFIIINIDRNYRNVAKILFIVGIMGNVLLIFTFKYYDFFVSNINALFATSFNLKNIILPLGISFYTIQQISYLVDAYCGKVKNYRFIEYVTYVTFFPQLVAGPIVLHSELIPQLRELNKRKFDELDFAEGLYKFIMGLSKKVILADTFGYLVNWAFEDVSILSSIEILLIMLCYSLEIYLDFSAYSDMAIGIGKMLRLEIPINFNSPYKSTSIIEFWKRWHMTLTRFLTQYIYFPLGGSLYGNMRMYCNIIIVFLVSGLWHGANWTFVVWGGCHGIAQVITRRFEKEWERIPRIIKWCATFTFVCTMWLLFRANSISEFAILCKGIMKMNWSISIEFKEIIAQTDIARILKHFTTHTGMSLIIYVAISLYICLVPKNLHEGEFHPRFGLAIGQLCLLTYCILSFAGTTTFIYFNF